MKYILVVLAGAADQPHAELNDKTPLDSAKIPHLHALAESGRVGTVKNVSDKAFAHSDASFLSTLGYDVKTQYGGRAMFEAANAELVREENEVVFCMNFITEINETLADPTAGEITSREAKALINYLNKKLASDFVRFYSCSEYRHLAMIKDSHGFSALSAKTMNPLLAREKEMEGIFPKGPGDELLKKLMFDAKLLLQDHEVNQVRVDLGENPANMIWLWGQGQETELNPMNVQYDFSSGAVVAVREFAKGAGRLAGLTVMDVKEEGLERADYYEKLAASVCSAAEDKDLVVLYLHSAEEASYKGLVSEKISALEGIDYYVISRLKKYIERNGDTKLLVTSAHAAHTAAKKVGSEAVPFLIAGKNIAADEVARFSEISANASEFKVSGGKELLTQFIS